MITDQNKQMIQELFKEGVCNRKFEKFNQYIDNSFVNHGIPDAQRGPEGFRQIIQTFMNAFPDMDITLESVVAEGNMVATRGIWTATHQDQFMGIAATGKKVAVRYMDFWKIENGKCVENWVQMDLLGLMQQLGVLEHEVA